MKLQNKIICIFAKPPVPGKTKSRLAEQVGKKNAADLSRAMLLDILEEAKRINEKLVLEKKVRLELDINEMDRFGRVLAYVFVDGLFVNEALLDRGAAEFQLDTVNVVYQDVLITAAQKAHQDKIGRWSKCAPNSKEGCRIKGNVDESGHRWYHLPHFRHYNQVVISPEKADRWFCTEAEAIEAGFKKARE